MIEKNAFITRESIQHSTINFQNFKRIISTVPSQTELLFDLGLDEEIVGLTWFCIHPAEKTKEKTKIGGTKNLDLSKIKALNPNLIIANKEENERSQIEALAKEFPVYVSDIFTLNDAYEMMLDLGKLTGKFSEADSLVNKIKVEFSTVKKSPEKLKSLYLIWKKPYMSVGKNTFINYMLEDVCGFSNVCAEDLRYPELSEERMKNLDPVLVLLSSEPYPFKEKHIADLQKMLPNAKILLVDGEMFSWYGSRLLHAPEYLKKLLQEINQ